MKKQEILDIIEKEVPNSWLHPILTGDNRILGEAPYDNRDIEKVCSSIKAQLIKRIKEHKPTTKRGKTQKGAKMSK